MISDIRLGAGNGDPLDDFVDDDAFVAFTEGIARPDVTLIVNGDFVDFAQIEPLGVDGLPSDLIWDESASLQKLDTAMAGHGLCFDSLRQLIGAGGHLRIIVGNHDFDFAWPRVQRRLQEFLGGSDDNVVFVVGSDMYAGVHIEHGYQFTPENCPRDPVHFIHSWADTTGSRDYLERVWGTDFLLRYFNDIERQYPFIDHVKPMIRVVWHGLKDGWLPKRSLVDIAVFLRRRGIPWRALTTMEGDAVTVEDVAGAFEDEHWQQLAAELIGEDRGEIEEALKCLSPEDRAFLAGNAQYSFGDSPDSGDTLAFGRPPREERCARKRLAQSSVTHVVFGHTHQIVDKGLGGSWFNPGCWIPKLDLESEYVAAKIRDTGVGLELFQDKSLFVTERRAVHIRPEISRARVELIRV